MQRCIDLALSAEGRTYPNPLVGSVIVHRGKIIGEGFHARAGAPHAEVNAINNVSNTDLLKDSTLYVNLEPCSHFGKTPPCSDLIIEKGIPQAVIGTGDIFPEVSGRGINKLRNAGVKVKVGVLEEECVRLNRRFFTFHGKNRPYIILKWAETTDGFIADDENNSKWISNAYSRMLVHKWRATEEAIMIGTHTALHDNPELTAREWPGRDPLRFITDSRGTLPQDLKIFNDNGKVVVFTGQEREKKGSVEYVRISGEASREEQFLQNMYRRGIQSVLIEGGSALLNSFISKGLWDEARVFTGTKKFGRGISAPSTGTNPVSIHKIDSDKLSIFENQNETKKLIKLIQVNKKQQ